MIICLLGSRQQTGQVGRRRRGEVEEGRVGADSADEPGDVAFGGVMQGSDVEVREWCGCDIFQHTSSSLPLIGVPPRWE